MRLIDAVTENIGLKALALLLAVVLWFSVAMSQDGTAELTVPVLLKDMSPQLTVADTPPSAIKLEIAGPRIVLMKLGRERLTATLDLKGVGEGAVAFTNLDRTVRLESGLRVIRVQPSMLELTLVKSGKVRMGHPEP